MKFKELAEYCKSIDIDCDKCEKKDLCNHLQSELEDISPLGVVELVNSNDDLEKRWL